MDQSTPRPDGAILDFAEDDLPVIGQSAKKSRKRKKVIAVDESTEVGSISLKNWQAEYLINMQNQKKRHISKHERFSNTRVAKLLVWSFRGQVLHPLLQDKFCNKAAIIPGSEWNTRSFLSTHQNGNEPERPLQQMTFDDDVELGRKGETDDLVSGRGSILPWNLSREGSMHPSLSGTGGLGAASNNAQDAPRQFSFLQTPVPNSRQASLRPGSRLSGTHGIEILEQLDSLDASCVSLSFVRERH